MRQNYLPFLLAISFHDLSVIPLTEDFRLGLQSISVTIAVIILGNFNNWVDDPFNNRPLYLIPCTNSPWLLTLIAKL